MRKSSVFFLVLFLFGIFFVSPANSFAQVMKKTQLDLQQDQAVIAAITPRAVNLQAGGPAVTVTVEGKYLETVLTVKAIRENRGVGEISVKLVQPWPASRKIELQAGAAAPVVPGYQLRFIGKAGMKEFRINVPLEVFSLAVVSVQTKMQQVQQRTLPQQGVSQVPKSGSPLAQMNLTNIGDIYKALMSLEQITCTKTYATNFEKELRVLEQLLAKARMTFAISASNLEERRATSIDIGNQIKALETDMEVIRNKRQEYQTMFENFDQKVNQLFNILSTVLKTQKEMDDAVSRNLNQ